MLVERRSGMLSWRFHDGKTMNQIVSLSPGMLRTNLRGQIRQTNLPKWKALLPLFEAVMNSFQAIQESKQQRDHRITIRIERQQDLFAGEDPPIIGFEVTDGGQRGGFDWFGNPPANQTLTAYGLLEFEDMAKVYDVDPALIQRTRDWLLSKRQPDGSWKADEGMLNDGLASSVQRGKDLNLATTAYVAWGVFGSRGPQAGLDPFQSSG